MNNYKISDKCNVVINSSVDDTPMMIFEDVPTQNISVNNKSVALNIDFDNVTMVFMRNFLDRKSIIIELHNNIAKIRHIKDGYKIISERNIDIMRIFDLKTEQDLIYFLNNMGYTQLVDPPEVI
jgi:hypothetical protein